MIVSAIAVRAENDYAPGMQLLARPRWLALCAMLALASGLVGQRFAPAHMDAQMMAPTVAGEMSPASGSCDGCRGGGDSMPVGCYALCGGTVALPPSAVPLQVVAIQWPTPLAARFDPGRVGPPDPYPPKASILS